MKKIAGFLVVAMSLAGTAQAGTLPWGKSMAQGHDLPRPFGIGVDLFEMNQDYTLQSLQFLLPGVPAIPPDLVSVKNKVNHRDLKFDAWVLPFLNVFALYGQVDARTDVDLSRVPAAALGLPPLGVVPVRYDGSVLGAGLTLAVGSDNWFASLTGTWTHSKLNGDFDSSVQSQSWQPRVGLVRGPWSAWVGGQYIAVEEKHTGVIQLLPTLPPIPFAVSLAEKSAWNPIIGARYVVNEGFDITGEYGGGARETALINATWRFGNPD